MDAGIDEALDVCVEGLEVDLFLVWGERGDEGDEDTFEFGMRW